MAIKKEVILKLQRLAKLQLPEEEKERLAQDIGEILRMVEKLKELDTSGIEPLTYPGRIQTPLREDVPAGEMLSQKEALANAPDAIDGFFRVKKFLEKK